MWKGWGPSSHQERVRAFLALAKKRVDGRVHGEQVDQTRVKFCDRGVVALRKEQRAKPILLITDLEVSH
jgi:hypothetical protein